MTNIKYINLPINTVINYIAILYALMVPISRAGISAGTAILFLLWLIEGDFKNKFKKLKDNNILISIFLFILWATLSLFWSDNIEKGIDSLRVYWYLLPIIVFSTSIKKEFLTKILSAFLVGMMISEILSYGIFFEWWQWKEIKPEDPSPFMNHLQYAMLLSFASLLLLNRSFFEKEIKWKVFYLFYFLTVTSNLFLNGGRTGHLAFAISIFVVGFVNIKNKIIAFLLMLLLVISIFYTAYQVSPVFKERFEQGSSEITNISSNNKKQYSGSFGARLALWIIGKDIVKENPLLGTGIGDELDTLKEKVFNNDYPKELTYRIRHEKLYKTHFHNAYIQYSVQLGLVGLFLYLSIFYFLLKLKFKDKELSNLRYVFISVFTISSLVEMMFSSQFSIAFFALFVGLFIGFSGESAKDVLSNS